MPFNELELPGFEDLRFERTDGDGEVRNEPVCGRAAGAGTGIIELPD